MIQSSDHSRVLVTKSVEDQWLVQPSLCPGLPSLVDTVITCRRKQWLNDRFPIVNRAKGEVRAFTRDDKLTRPLYSCDVHEVTDRNWMSTTKIET